MGTSGAKEIGSANSKASSSADFSDTGLATVSKEFNCWHPGSLKVTKNDHGIILSARLGFASKIIDKDGFKSLDLLFHFES